MKGFEPPTPSLPWKCSTPELHWPSSKTSSLKINSSGRRDSNPRPSAWKADALPTELLPLVKFQYIVMRIVGVVGFEPTQPKHWIYSPAHLSNCGAPPLFNSLYIKFPGKQI